LEREPARLDAERSPFDDAFMNAILRISSLMMAMVLLGTSAAVAERDKELEGQVKEALRLLKDKDSTFEEALEKAHGYVIFPSVGKGGFIIGGAGGKGEVYQGDDFIGTAKLSQATIGAQVGGQSFIEVILFSDRIALNEFKRGDFEFSAGVSAVAASEGVAEKADYENGMAVIILPKAGLMVEASIGGQKFSYKPVPKEE
jgi:lipid-binding SYLF domain-containing protein